MKVPISGRVKTSSRASTARRMSVAFFLVRPVRRAQIISIGGLGQRDDVLRVAAPIGVGRAVRPLSLDDVRLQQAAQLRLEIRADPIVTLSKSSSAPRWARGRGVRGEPVVASGLVAVASCECVLLLVASPRTHAAPGRQAAGRAGVAKAGAVVVRAPEPGRLKGGDRCALQSRCGSPVRVAHGGPMREGLAIVSRRACCEPRIHRGCQALPD